MTENELFKAVHAYAAHLADHGEDISEDVARAKLLQVIEEWSFGNAAIRRAKVAVCDAAIAMHSDPSNHALGDVYRAAVDGLRELEAKR